ncbi:OpgC domain-containing protein [Trinickia fusca]|uniref:OpgC domain-containing protein n=1 Tax=Trinickia fusca TaxID=2419777 RepID=A0A494XTA1_9BURK|nr:OpgC domain-containing protein [Trinickia fusca]RKP50753.1 OpgC domain-containing protein [Trinickia fusca]
MNASAARSVEVDFLRGIVLIVIAIDHISVSVLSHAMLHSYAYCDAAEVFVFLGGYASAASYAAIAARRGEAAARRRFLRRAWEIYRAYGLTAALMLGCGLLLTLLPLTSPLVALTDWPTFARHPLTVLANIVSLREQPFLSAVLPMYVLFALLMPLSMPLARRMPLAAFVVSLGVWFGAPSLGSMLPGVGSGGWPFNPFAWQLMFMLGMLCRLHPVPEDMQASNIGDWLTSAAFAVALSFAFVKLCIDSNPQPGFMKQNLASVRIVSFLALAWLAAQTVRLGWMRALATRLPAVVTIGRQGLVCFVCGTLVSIGVDTALRLMHLDTIWLPRLLGDLAAVFALMLIARLASQFKTMRARVAVPASTMPVAPARVCVPERFDARR